MDEALRAELLARRDEDQRIRLAIPPSHESQEGERIAQEFADEWARIDEDNTAWLAELVAARGWPGRSLVGDDGASAAWLLAQHADRRPHLQRVFLERLRAAVAEGEAFERELAYLEDRQRVNAGRPQLYGTQFTVHGEEFGPQPIEDPGHLDERRAAVGLEPFADYEARMREVYEGRTRQT